MLDEVCSGIHDVHRCSLRFSPDFVKGIIHRSLKIGNCAVDTFALFFEHPIKFAALGCGCNKGLSHHLGGDFALFHLLFEFADGFPGLLADYREGIEASVNHLQEVLSHELACRAHLRKGEGEAVKFLRVAHRDVADGFQYWHNFLRLDVEGEHSLRSFGEVAHHHWGMCCKLLDFRK